MTMNADIKAKWLAALRSGEYQQGRYRIRTPDSRYCCLGVLADVLDGDGWERYSFEYDWQMSGRQESFPVLLRDQVGLPMFDQKHLSSMNDFERKPFAEIADYIEEKL